MLLCTQQLEGTSQKAAPSNPGGNMAKTDTKGAGSTKSKTAEKSTMLLAGQRRTARRATAADRPRSRPHGHPSVSVTAGTRWTKPSRSRPARSTPSSRSRWTSTAHSSPTARQRSSLGRSSRPSRTSSSRPERSGPTPL